MYDSIKNGGINVWAIFWGIGYFAYRKMYLVAIIVIVLADIISYLIPGIGNYTGTIIGIMFCPLYRWDVTRKLRKIKKDNPGVDESKLLAIAQKKVEHL